MHRSKIEWCDFSAGYANFVRRGKAKGECEISPSCTNCYVKRYWRINPDAWPDKTTWYPEKLKQLSRCRPRPNEKPYRRGPGSKPMVFVCDTGDLFHRRVPADFVFSALDVMYEREDIDWQILTKRHQRAHHLIIEWLKARDLGRLPPWMWIVFTIENQEWLEQRLPYLIYIPATVRGISFGPLLGPIDILNSGMWDWRYTHDYWKTMFPDVGPPIHWFAVEGESRERGAVGRYMSPDWVRSLRDQAKQAGVAFLLKQWGDYKPQTTAEHNQLLAAWWDPGQFRGGRMLDGQMWNEFPKEALT